MILTSWVYVYVPSIHSFNGIAVEVAVVNFNLVSVWLEFSLKWQIPLQVIITP